MSSVFHSYGLIVTQAKHLKINSYRAVSFTNRYYAVHIIIVFSKNYILLNYYFLCYTRRFKLIMHTLTDYLDMYHDWCICCRWVYLLLNVKVWNHTWPHLQQRPFFSNVGMSEKHTNNNYVYNRSLSWNRVVIENVIG